MNQEYITAEELLRDSTLNIVDAARLVLELQEALGRRVRRRSRGSLMELMRKTLHAGVQVLEQEAHTVTLEQAAWASVEARNARLRPVSRRDLRYYVRRLLRVEEFSRMPLRSMKPKQCRELLQKAFPSFNNGYVKARAVLHSIFAYGIRQEWCDTNPVSRIDVPRLEEKTIEPLSPEAAEKLLEQAKGSDMQLSLRLMLYAGLRPTEVARLKPEDFCWQEKVVIIRPVTAKTGGGRVVPLRGCEHLTPGQRIIPPNWQRRWRVLRNQAGFDHWVADTCRHTFATYHAAYFRNLPELQLEMGHRNLSQLRNRYMRPATAAAAQRFWETARQ